MGRERRYTKGTNFCLEMVEGFENLVTELKPNKQYIRRGKQIANLIFHVLRSSNLSVDRVKVAGSIGKGTEISYYKDDNNELQKKSDFDLVVYLNGEKPPFDTILETFKHLLEEHIPELRGNIIKTKISLQFTYHDDSFGEIEFDLLPAENHVKQKERDSEEIGDVQAKVGFEKLKRDIRRNGGKVTSAINRMHSTSFCEKSMDFIRAYIERDEFYRDVIILAKYWIAMLDLEWYVSARSYMTEIIAIHSQKRKTRKCIIAGFRRFLVTMANFQNLYVDIGGVGNNRENDPYFKQVINGNRPIILSPVNPYNNLAAGINPNVVETLMSQARKTIQILDSNTSVDEDNVENVIDDIFARK